MTFGQWFGQWFGLAFEVLAPIAFAHTLFENHKLRKEVRYFKYLADSQAAYIKSRATLVEWAKQRARDEHHESATECEGVPC